MGVSWDDSPNNFATGLSLFITLFGEAPTKQYLSECLSVVDAIIFAIAPLGVITSVVSAIPVTGPPSLRAFIGRAQKGSRSAEADRTVLFDKPRSVRVLYQRRAIARILGRPKLLEIVHEQHVRRTEIGRVIDSESELATAGIYTFKEYIRSSNECVQEGRGNPSLKPASRSHTRKRREDETNLGN
jgi:hypothetical protein